MRVLSLDTTSLMTSSGIGTYSQIQQLPNSPEALQTDAREHHPPSLKLMARKRAIKDVIGSRGNGTQILSGWKEIANYMHQGVRTVQRWESIGLPVRRVTKSRRAPVIAFAEDLDAWARSLHVPLLDRIEELRATISSLEAEIGYLKRELRVRNRSAHMDKTRTSHAITQLSQGCASGSPPRCRSNNPSRTTLNDSFGSAA